MDDDDYIGDINVCSFEGWTFGVVGAQSGYSMSPELTDGCLIGVVQGGFRT